MRYTHFTIRAPFSLSSPRLPHIFLSVSEVIFYKSLALAHAISLCQQCSALRQQFLVYTRIRIERLKQLSDKMALYVWNTIPGGGSMRYSCTCPGRNEKGKHPFWFYRHICTTHCLCVCSQTNTAPHRRTDRQADVQINRRTDG